MSVPLSVPEVRRLLQVRAADAAEWRRRLHWLRWRQAHQTRARRCHSARRAQQFLALPGREPVVVVVPGTAALTERIWMELAPVLPPQKAARGRPANDHRRILEGMLWVMRTGSAWRFLPEHFGPWQTIHSRYQRWGKGGIWQQIMALLHPEAKRPFDLR